MSDKQSYSAPQIVDFGSVVESTTGDSSPVRDNTASTTYDYYDSSKRSGRHDLDREVDLGDR